MPRDHAGRVRDAMLELRRSGELPSGPRTVDDLVDRLNRPPERPGRTIALTGPPELLHETILVAIDEAGEAVSDGCTRLLRREGDSGDVRAEVEALEALLQLLGALEEAD